MQILQHDWRRSSTPQRRKSLMSENSSTSENDARFSSPLFGTGLAAIIEKLVNKALQYDPGSRIALGELEGSKLLIISTSPSFSLGFEPLDGLFYVSSSPNTKTEHQSENKPHPLQVTLTGSLMNLAQLAKGEQHSLAQTGVDVSGKVHLLVAYQDFFSQLDIDWEEALADHLGTLAGHQLANFFRSSFSWSKDQFNNFEAFFPEYLTEELAVIISKNEFENFSNKIDATRAQYDRLKAKVQRLKNRI